MINVLIIFILKNIYQIHIWTMESRIERFGEGMDIIIDSFTEL